MLAINPVDNNSLLRGDQNNDLKSRRSQERERIKKEAETKKNEMLKKISREHSSSRLQDENNFNKPKMSLSANNGTIKIVNNDLEIQLQ